MIKLYTRQQGEGPDLVLLHGLFGSADNLGVLSRGLQHRFKVTSFDLRDHGRSPHSDQLTYRDMATDVLAMLNELGIEKTHVFGHSMGGKVAMQMAATAGNCIDHLMVGDIAPIAYGDHHTAVLKAQRLVQEAGPAIKSRSDAEAIMQPHIKEDGVLPFLLTNLRRVQAADHGTYMAWRHNLDLIIRDYGHIAAAPDEGAVFDRPTLFIKGARSDYITEAASDAVKARFSMTRLHVLSGTGHWFHAEKPEATLRALEEFLP